MNAWLGFIISFFLIPITLMAQKNMIPATRISALNITLPKGSKQDKRFLSTVAAGALLETEVNDPNIYLSGVEVYVLPPASQSGFDEEFLVSTLEKSGFEILPTDDDRVAWLVKEQAAYLIYFSMDKSETSFYIGKSNIVPKTTQATPAQYTTPTVAQQSTPAHIPSLPPVQSSTKAPVSDHASTQSSTSNQTQTVQKTPTISISGFQFTTSSFDDGWSSTIQPDWVLVQKGETKVYLFFVLSYRSENFSGTGLMDRDFYWDNHVAPIFKTTTKAYQDGGEFISSLQPKYVEGWGADPQTGQKRFIGMFLTVSPNAARLTVACSTSEAGFRQTFPRAADRWDSDLVRMISYNKFAVGTNDLNGTWQSGGSQMTQWYNSVTGAYAGATFASSSATFSFSGNTYSSIHNGATGAVGAMNTFQQEYKGNATITNWNITMTNRYQGKTQQFDAHFQAVRGGRLLYLNDRSGGEYTLVKIN